eukprot:jgi/Chrzof1/5896/Cz16g19220.t1
MSSAAKRIKTEADLIAEELTEEMDDITEGTEAMDEAPAASVNDVETGDFDAATASGSDDETHMGMGVSMAVQRLKHESAESAGSDCSPAASGGSLLCGMERASSTEMDVVTRMMGTAAAGGFHPALAMMFAQSLSDAEQQVYAVQRTRSKGPSRSSSKGQF